MTNHPKLHPDRKTVLVVIFHLRFGKGGSLDGRPHHRLGAAIERAVHQEFLEFRRDDPLGAKIHGEIGPVPIAGDAQPLEFLALHIDPAFGEPAAFLPEIDEIQLILVEALGAVLLLDLPFDGQAMAVPARNVARVIAHHLLAAHHHVLEDLVESMADMKMPIGIGRAIMQREGRAPFRPRAQAIIDADLFPTGKPFGLAPGQARAHRKIGLRQIERVFVIKRIGAHGGVLCHCRIRKCRRGGTDRRMPCPGGSSRSERRACNSGDDQSHSHHAGRYRRGCKPRPEAAGPGCQ